MSGTAIAERIRGLDWDTIAADIDTNGHALTRPLLDPAECRELIGLFADDERFRSTVNMRQVCFGSGVYRYFDRPLPAPVAVLREHFYPPLAEIANDWAARLRQPSGYPDRLDEFLEICHDHGQTSPTPILFHYETGDHNALHQDLYGDLACPFQIVTVLSPPDTYTGGEFVLCTQRPRAQTLVEVVTPGQGQILIFPNRYKPVLGKQKGRYYRTTIRHGVSRLHRGERYSLGIIFHDAR